MLTSLLLLSLAQAPTQVKLAAPGLSCVGLEPGLCDVYVERFATVLGREKGLVVTTGSDIARVLGFERQKQLLGCADTASSCMGELAGALGVDALLGGSLAKTGGGYVATLRVVRASDGQVLATASERHPDAAALEAWLDSEAAVLGERLRAAFGITEAPSRGGSLVRWVPAMAGGAAAVAGAVCFGLGKADAAALSGGTVPLEAIDSTAQRGAMLQPLGVALLAAGAAGIAASVLWVALGGDAPPVALVPHATGVTLSFGGTF